MDLEKLTNEELESLSNDIQSEKEHRETLKSSSYITSLNRRFQGRFVRIDNNGETIYGLVKKVVDGCVAGLFRFDISKLTFSYEEPWSIFSIQENSFIHRDVYEIDAIKIVDQSEIMRYFESIVMKLRESVKRNVIESNLDS